MHRILNVFNQDDWNLLHKVFATACALTPDETGDFISDVHVLADKLGLDADSITEQIEELRNEYKTVYRAVHEGE